MSAKSEKQEEEALVPADLRNALSVTPNVGVAWSNLTSIGRRDFISWINEAKQAETRQRRIERCCENLLKGKKRPCCYAVLPMDFYKALANSPDAKAHWTTLNANEKRDISDWIEDSRDKPTRKIRIEEAVARLEVGK
jgi:uncharacterized protein YdeI (YjbR/CyaY-like superfamily)